MEFDEAVKIVEAKLDEVDIIIGGASVIDRFVPNINCQKWNDECWLNINHPDIVTAEKESTVDGKTSITIGNNTHRYYIIDGKLEYEIEFEKRPKNNTVELSLDFPEGLDFFYQDSLYNEWLNSYQDNFTFKEYQKICHRPENVVGSYAVYWKESNNQYKTGKFCHIYRPKLIDARGSEIWAELFIDPKTKKLLISMDRAWLDKAVYPVILDPLLGYTTVGSSNLGYNNITAAIAATTDGTGGAINSYHCAVESIDTNPGIKMGCYNADQTDGDPSSKTLVESYVEFDVAVSDDESCAGGSTSLAASTKYSIVFISEEGGTDLKYDTSSGNEPHYRTGQVYSEQLNSPADAAWSSGTWTISMWIDYGGAESSSSSSSSQSTSQSTSDSSSSSSESTSVSSSSSSESISVSSSSSSESTSVSSSSSSKSTSISSSSSSESVSVSSSSSSESTSVSSSSSSESESVSLSSSSESESVSSSSSSESTSLSSSSSSESISVSSSSSSESVSISSSSESTSLSSSSSSESLSESYSSSSESESISSSSSSESVSISSSSSSESVSVSSSSSSESVSESFSSSSESVSVSSSSESQSESISSSSSSESVSISESISFSSSSSSESISVSSSSSSESISSSSSSESISESFSSSSESISSSSSSESVSSSSSSESISSSSSSESISSSSSSESISSSSSSCSLDPTKVYSRGDYAALPGDDITLETAFTCPEYPMVAIDDDIYVQQTGCDEYILFLWKDQNDDDKSAIIVQWKGKSDRAPSISTVYLQIYNRNTTTWETLASNNVVAADVEFTLLGTQAANLSNYYDGANWVSCRIYQRAI